MRVNDFPQHITEDFMPRKRKSDDTPSTDNTNITPDSGAAETANAVAEPPVSTPANPAAAAEPPVAESGRGGFADRVGQKQRTTIPDPFGIATDHLAGVRLFESRQDRQMAIKFGDGSSEAKPSQAVINRMKEAGYRWNPGDRVWTHPVRPDSALSTRIEAEQLYQEVRQMIRQEKGIEPGQEVPF
jgi:hypothetical protein